MRSRRLHASLALAFMLLFVAIYGGTSWLSARRVPLPAPHFAFEASIPFVPEMAWVYLSVPLMLVIAAFTMRTKGELLPFFFTLTSQLVVAGLCYLIQPVSPVWPPRVVEGPGTVAFQIADAFNLDYNEFPSLHVAFAATAAFVFSRRFGSIGRLVIWTWFLAAVASTLMLHEHHVPGVVAGAALAALTLSTVHRRTSRTDFLEALHIELLCLSELALFARRHRRYLLTGLTIWTYSVGRWGEMRLLRAGFCLAQHLDDVLDGDRRIEDEPVAYVRGLLRGEPGRLAPLAACVLAELDRRKGCDKLTSLVELLIQDRERMNARRTMPAAALAAHHRATFALSLDLTLVAVGSELRARDAPSLIDALAWCSPIRDLEEDLAKGLINIPEEVLARVTGQADPQSMLAAEPVRAWLCDEHVRAAESLIAARPGERTAKTTRDPGWAVIGAFHRALAAYEQKYRRHHADFVYEPYETAR
jgi:hypothetical protein